MANLRLGLWIGLLVLLGLFVLQNWLPVLPLVVFGNATIALPAGIWLAIAAAAGFLTGLILRLLAALGRGPSRQPVESVARSPRTQSKSRATERASRRQPVVDWERASSADWKDAEEDEWDIENPPERSPESFPRAVDLPKQPTAAAEAAPRDRVISEPSRPPAVEDAPHTRSNQRATASPGTVYDADYRVINPPLWDVAPQAAADSDADADEDWDFLDDDDRDP
ncbi:hypothetical protein KR51_00036200 [Rubidibacter lacunae KORDI 51-2]|uniref:Lipopolysaccharide assembly protein A domain-containing protein n=1 Tax=Rubidibacter lacunae KORDI 51-2 TaxID=582515 RepID=U5DH81_9CHRO|nr:A24 family peptidase [Rubidibacter lacunae]ERN39919.1 hypothetical protein KR51_00036200 [Rubidibacter lacunae KORDI 51-2]